MFDCGSGVWRMPLRNVDIVAQIRERKVKLKISISAAWIFGTTSATGPHGIEWRFYSFIDGWNGTLDSIMFVRCKLAIV